MKQLILFVTVCLLLAAPVAPASLARKLLPEARSLDAREEKPAMRKLPVYTRKLKMLLVDENFAFTSTLSTLQNPNEESYVHLTKDTEQEVAKRDDEAGRTDNDQFAEEEGRDIDEDKDEDDEDDVEDAEDDDVDEDDKDELADEDQENAQRTEAEDLFEDTQDLVEEPMGELAAAEAIASEALTKVVEAGGGEEDSQPDANLDESITEEEEDGYGQDPQAADTKGAAEEAANALEDSLEDVIEVNDLVTEEAAEHLSERVKDLDEEVMEVELLEVEAEKAELVNEAVFHADGDEQHPEPAFGVNWHSSYWNHGEKVADSEGTSAVGFVSAVKQRLLSNVQLPYNGLRGLALMQMRLFNNRDFSNLGENAVDAQA